jgi:hypothetical protein
VAGAGQLINFRFEEVGDLLGRFARAIDPLGIGAGQEMLLVLNVHEHITFFAVLRDCHGPSCGRRLYITKPLVEVHRREFLHNLHYQLFLDMTTYFTCLAPV